LTIYRRTRDELEQELAGQIAALTASCNGYDAGNRWEGPRIATAVYNLVNDGKKKSLSLLTQLGIRNSIKYISHATARDPRNLMAWAPLIGMEMSYDGKTNIETEYYPILDTDENSLVRRISFSEWWNEPIFENSRGAQLSRMNLTFALRSKDGGSHFDPELPIGLYLELKQTGFGLSVAAHDGNGQVVGKPAKNGHLATMRHIAFELLQSIDS
jgi:hypothetical protein